MLPSLRGRERETEPMPRTGMQVMKTVVLALAILAAAAPAQAGDAAAGKVKAGQCKTCHGIDGIVIDTRIPLVWRNCLDLSKFYVKCLCRHD